MYLLGARKISRGEVVELITRREKELCFLLLFVEWGQILEVPTAGWRWSGSVSQGSVSLYVDDLKNRRSSLSRFINGKLTPETTSLLPFWLFGNWSLCFKFFSTIWIIAFWYIWGRLVCVHKNNYRAPCWGRIIISKFAEIDQFDNFPFLQTGIECGSLTMTYWDLEYGIEAAKGTW